jgi:hypothetical protein
MTIDEILSHLQRNEGHFAKDAVLAAVAQRDEIIPRLLDVLRDIADNPEPYAAAPDSMILIYAMFLLAQFRESRAYPLLVRIFSYPGEMPFDLAGDTVTENLGRILACVSEGEVGGMAALIENEQANPYVRSAGMDGLLTLVACGQRTREETIAYLHQLFRKMERVHSYAWDSLACACVDLWPGEVMDDLRSAYDGGLIDPGVISWKNIQSWHARGQEACLKYTQEKYTPVTDVVKEMEWWACFDKDRKLLREKESPVSLGAFSSGLPDPIFRTGPKVGRNDPCPCGSGKKFKKCCGG